jgi:P-type Mg2+ transporter
LPIKLGRRPNANSIARGSQVTTAGGGRARSGNRNHESCAAATGAAAEICACSRPEALHAGAAHPATLDARSGQNAASHNAARFDVSDLSAPGSGGSPGHRPAGPPAARAKSKVPAELTQFARLEASLVLEQLGTGVRGLSEAEARNRIERIGRNAVAPERAQSVPLQLLKRLANPLNILLLTLASMSMVIGDREVAVIILVMVILSVSLSFFQERRSTQAAAKLRAMVHTTATVVRSSEATARPGPTPTASVEGAATMEIPIELIAPGDVVHICAGDMVPGDLRLLAAKDLYVNQASLTGESLPIEKSADADPGAAADSVSLGNICFMGTNVVSGSATGVIVLTGARAYFGTLANIIAAERAPTDFDKGVNQVAWLMIRFILVMAPLVFLINGFTKGNWLEALLFAVAVAVGLTPEMLPMIVTVNLSKGAIAMSRKRVIVKRLNSIQNFGAMDILCTDKTGTLTQDQIILEKHVDLTGAESARVLEYAYLNSFHQSGLKNLLDVAVLRHATAPEMRAMAEEYRKIDEVPFDFQRRRMSVVVEGHGQRLLICKGAVEEVFAVSTRGAAGTAVFDLDIKHLEQLRLTSEGLNEDGFRVIALAYKELPTQQPTCSVKDESDLTLLGYIAFLDPPKDTARAAIATLNGRGVQVKILTGDNATITGKICRDVGLSVERVMLGSEVDALSEVALAQAAEQTQVFAKLSPTQKSAVIHALQTTGHVVGFLGDGINDGPALKAADVGVSVDSAVDIAKESADIILLEKSLMALGDGVIEGRKVFGNIIKYIRMGASSNFGNMFSVIGASLWLPFLPMAAVQVLTNNLLYDLSQTAIPTDNIDSEYLERPRRWEIRNVGRFMLFIGPISSIFDYATYFVMYFVFQANTVAQASVFQTGWFVESLLSQTLIIHIIRTRRIPFVESRASLPLILTSLAVCAIGLWLPFSPIAGALGFTPPPPRFWPILAAMLAAYLIITHLMKTWFHRRFGLD